MHICNGLQCDSFMYLHTGGKKKPLKVPKKQSKEMDEVSLGGKKLVGRMMFCKHHGRSSRFGLL